MHFLLLLLNLFIVTVVYSQNSIVSIEDGKVQGSMHKIVGSNKYFYAYTGIPFAKPPVGDLRFRAPVKNDPWPGILNATQEERKCIQTSGILGLTIDGSEDCLYLNVYTTNISGNLPVMVWIYGGGFTIGGSEYSVYAPDFLLERDIVFVSFNYRLGIFGFLSTEDLSCPGNWGLKDQVLALQWVKRNIHAFGGNPEKITIFGQSAGSVSIGYILQNPKTQGLYHAAIMQSGTSLCLWALSRTARQIAFGIGARLGIFTPDSEKLVDGLRRIDYKILKRAENDVYYVAIAIDNTFNGLPMGPVQEPEHEGAVFTSKSHEMLRTGKFNKVPVIIGLNSNEAKSFLGLFIDVLKPLYTRYDVDIAKLAPYDLTRNFSKRILAGGQIKEHYFGVQPIATRSSEKIIHFTSVDQFNRPIRETVNQMSKYTEVYYYQFAYRGTLGEFDYDFTGVGHFEDIFYIFANKVNGNSGDKIARLRLLELWTNFAKYGNPTPTPLEGITWIPNTPNTQQDDNIIYLSINSSLTLKSNPNQNDWEFYQNLYYKYGDPPHSTY